MSGRVIGLVLDHVARGPFQFRPPPLRLQGRPEVEVRAGELGIQADGPLQYVFGLGVPILGEQHGAEGSVGAGRDRLQRQRGAIRLLGLDVTAPLGQELAKVTTRADVARLQADRLGERRLRFAVPALPVQGHAEATME